MGSETEVFQSRLAGRAATPVRGIGSAYAANQKMSGAVDPVEAARIAGLEPSEESREVEREERLASARSSIIEGIVNLVMEGAWLPPGMSSIPSGWRTGDWESHLANKSIGEIQAMLEEGELAAKEAQDAEDKATIEKVLGENLSVDVSDPNYNPLVDTERKRRIEAALEPLDFEEMVWKGSCAQKVSLRSNFEAVYRTLSTQHALWLEYYMSKQDTNSYQHTSHMFSIVQLSASLDSINGRSVGTDLTRYTRNDQREEYLKALESRMEFVGRLPSQLSDDLIVNYVWFTGRVRRLLAGDVLGKVGNF